MIVKEVVRDEAQVVLHGKKGAAVVFSKVHPLYHVDWFPGMRAKEDEAGYMGVNVKGNLLNVGGKTFTAKDPVAIFNAILSILPHPNEVVLTGEVGDDGVFATEMGYFDIAKDLVVAGNLYVMMGEVNEEEEMAVRQFCML